MTHHVVRLLRMLQVCLFQPVQLMAGTLPSSLS